MYPKLKQLAEQDAEVLWIKVSALPQLGTAATAHAGDCFSDCSLPSVPLCETVAMPATACTAACPASFAHAQLGVSLELN